MKFKYCRTEEGTVEIAINDGRKVTVILHPCGELDFEGWDCLTEEEQNKLTDWVCETFRIDTNEYDHEL